VNASDLQTRPARPLPVVRDGDEGDDRGPPAGDRVAWGPLSSRIIAAFVVLTAALSGIGLLYVNLELSAALRHDDLGVSQWFAEHRAAGWDDFAMFWSHAADTVAIVGVAASAIALLWWRGHRAAAALVGFGLALEAATFITTNNLVRRERPQVDTLGDSPTTFSFPSGHVAATVVLYGALAVILLALARALWLRAVLVLAPVLIVSSVAFARVYRGMHYLSDVVAGLLLGLVVLALALHFLRETSPTAEEAWS
jgi:undecaprenyl-diphosphatase